MREKKHDFFCFDVLKCISIIIVVFIHIVSCDLYYYCEISSTDWMMANIVNYFRRICVPIFVMVSGFFLLRKAEEVKILFKKR